MSLTLLAGVTALLALVMTAYVAFTNPRFSFAALLLLLPFHTGFFLVARVELGLSSTVATLLQTWKEAVLLLLLAWVAAKALSSLRLRVAHFWMVLLVGLFILTGLLALRSSPSLAAGLYSFRGTFEPFIVLLLALLLPLDLTWVKRLIPWMFASGVLVALFAIYQSLVLGYPFLWKYYAQDGILPSSFVFMGGSIQRAMGTFSSPNQLSLYLALLIILAVNLLLRLKSVNRYILPLIALFFTALLLTVSRSGWAALLAGLGVSFLLWRRKQRLLLIGIILAFLAIIIASAIGLDTWLVDTISGREISANYHADMFSHNIQVILNNPLGVGLGRVGARSLRFGTGASGVYATESYLLQTGMELGVPGLVLFLTIILLSGMILYTNIRDVKDRWSRALTITALAAIAAALVHSLLIPDLQDMTVASYLWIMVGLGMRLPILEKQAAAKAQPLSNPLPDTQGVA